MSLRRFLPDLILVSMALATCAWALARASGWRRIAILAAQMLLGAGLCVTLLQASAQETGYRLLMISGLAFATAACIVWAAGVHLVRRRIDPQRRRVLSLASSAVMAAPIPNDIR